jgi:hypothetical protein
VYRFHARDVNLIMGVSAMHSIPASKQEYLAFAPIVIQLSATEDRGALQSD